MASLGAAKTGKFEIGTAELRVGPLTSAGRLTRAHSVGLIDATVLTVDQTSVDLLGGFPQVVMDTQVVNQSAQVSATLREFSRRNLGLMLGQGLVYAASTDGISDYMTAVTGDGSGTSLTVAQRTGLASDGGWITVYRPNNAGDSFIAKVKTGGTGTGALVLEDDFPLPIDIAAADGWRVAKLAPIAIGNVSAVNYFCVQALTLDRQTGRPKIANFWKAAIGSGMSLTNNATDFASTELILKILQPALNDYEQASAPMYHLRDVIESYPMGMFGTFSDNATDSNTDVTTTTTAAP